MGQLVFYDKGHVYELDGVVIPSVSEVIRFLSREEYGDVNQYLLDNAAQRGTAVHKACEKIVKTGECEAGVDIAGYVRAFIKFCEDHECRFTDSETALACRQYAGTLDLCGLVDGRFSIVDIKTSYAVKKTLVKAQLNGYLRLWRENREASIEALHCLQLLQDGKYRLYPVAIDSTEFDACLTLHESLKRKHARGKIS